MLSRKKSNQSQQIPYSLYETLQKDTPKKGRWLIDMLIAAVVVLLVTAGGVWLYKFVHDAKTSSTPGTTDTTQSPQQDTTKQNNQAPVSTPESSSSNSQNITQPSN